MSDPGLQGQTFAGYEVISLLGRGGMGAVWKARQPMLNRFVALKVMAPDLAADAEFVKRFKREAAAAANLSHENLVQVYAAGEFEKTHYIAMEFVDGETLRQKLDRHGKLDPREAVAITTYIALALQYAWNKTKLIHRDIKPDNIFLTREGGVRVGDMGLAKTVGGPSTSLTQTGMMMGSPHYISPEQATARKEIDFRADIYSLGCTLYHMLTGRPPYEGDDAMAVMNLHVVGPPPAIFNVWPTCPVPLAVLVGKMVAKKPHERPQSYEELIAQLRDVHDKLKRAATPAPVAARPTPADAEGTVTYLAARGAAKTPAPPAKLARWSPRFSVPLLSRLKPALQRAVLIGVPVVIALAGLFIWSPWKNRRDEQGRREGAKMGLESRLQAESVSGQPAKAGTPNAAAALKLLGPVYKNAVGGEMVYIPPGEFMLGSTKEEQAWAVANGAKVEDVKREGEAPRKAVIKQGFWLGRTEVTVGQWKEFVTATGYKTDAEKKGYVDHAPRKGQPWGRVDGLSWRDPGFGSSPQDNHPVCCVSWNDAVAFCEWLTERERKAGRLLASHVVRLPTEAEWEYACRAGMQAKFWWGDAKEPGDNRRNFRGAEDGFELVAPVDSYGDRGRNKFGLADTLGNVYEWCLDDFDAAGAREDYYKGNPSGRVLRGGSFSRIPSLARCASRYYLNPSFSDSDYGFRLCFGLDVLGSAATKAAPAAPKEAGILAPAETRVAALTAKPKVGEVATLDLGGGVTMELMGIPPGEFLLGSTKEEQAWAIANGAAEETGKREGEAPRKATMKQGFWLGRTEVTVGQWKEFITATGYRTDAEKKGYADFAARKGQPWGRVDGLSWRDPGFGPAPQDRDAVSCISWNDAMAFCEWATERERKAGRLAAGQMVRLPTEAEWEYACRAGTQTKFWWGESKEDGKDRLNRSGTADGFEFVSPVDHYGLRGRNKFGLADMLGNVFEWCLDEYDPKQAHEECYKGNPGGRAVRGGSFMSNTASNRSADRGINSPSLSISHVGFRVCCGPDVLGSAATAAAPVAQKEGGIFAPAETRVSALTTNPKVGEVFTLPFSGNVTMELMGIPPGEFMMGSTPEERAWAVANGALEGMVKREGEAPRKAVIKQGFWMGRTEVTVGQWKQFVKETGYKSDAEKKGYVDYVPRKGQPWGRVDGLSWRDPGFGSAPMDNHPVSCVSWNDAVAFCAWLTDRERKTGCLAAGQVVRLPTEAEWECACRAGSQTKFWWGETQEDGKDRLNWGGSADGFEFVSPVDHYRARGRNEFGLADMLGNVWEWCLDDYDEKQAHEECYKGNPDGRMLRGGALSYSPVFCRCAYRCGYYPAYSSCTHGFRVAVGVDVSGARAATGVDDAFIKEVAALPAEQQVARVVAKLKELNPRFDPATTEVTHKIENGVVTEFGFDGRNVTDLSPVRALTGVKKLKCGGAPVKSRLADLSAIRGLQLTFLDCKNSMVRDLSPLRGMPLTQLNCCGTRVDDLSPLKGMPLTRLVCYSTKVEDLSPLAGLPLETLACYNTRVSDLSPLKGMPLKGLSCQMTLITDLTPLRGLPLNHLSLNGCPVSDLSPLTGTPLNVLHVHSTQVRTLTPLRGTPLTELSCDFVPQRDTELLLSIKTLKMINDLPAAEFWKKVEAGEAPKP